MIPRHLFTTDYEIFRQSVRKFIQTELVLCHAQWEKDGVVSRRAWPQAGAGLMCCSPEYMDLSHPGECAHRRRIPVWL